MANEERLKQIALEINKMSDELNADGCAVIYGYINGDGYGAIAGCGTLADIAAIMKSIVEELDDKSNYGSEGLN